MGKEDALISIKSHVDLHEACLVAMVDEGEVVLELKFV